VTDLLRGRADPALRDAARESALLRAARRGFVGAVEVSPRPCRPPSPARAFTGKALARTCQTM